MKSLLIALALAVAPATIIAPGGPNYCQFHKVSNTKVDIIGDRGEMYVVSGPYTPTRFGMMPAQAPEGWDEDSIYTATTAQINSRGGALKVTVGGTVCESR